MKDEVIHLPPPQRKSTARHASNRRVHHVLVLCILLVIFTTGYLLNPMFRGDSRLLELKYQRLLREEGHILQEDRDEGNINVSPDEVQNVRVLCWLVTSPEFLVTRAIHVKNTWGSRCDKTLYFSSIKNESFPTVKLDVKEGREHLTAKSLDALRYIYEHYFDDFDWFIKADDNTYVIVENLKLFLIGENTEESVYFGHRFKNVIPGGYASGGAGYVLSREALQRIHKHAYDETLCRQDGGPEDVEIGICLHNLGVALGKSTDSQGRSRFHCFDPGTHIMGSFPPWFYKYDSGGGKSGMNTLSDFPISFHYLKPSAMYMLHYLLYHARPYGLEEIHSRADKDTDHDVEDINIK